MQAKASGDIPIPKPKADVSEADGSGSAIILPTLLLSMLHQNSSFVAWFRDPDFMSNSVVCYDCVTPSTICHARRTLISPHSKLNKPMKDAPTLTCLQLHRCGCQAAKRTMAKKTEAKGILTPTKATKGGEGPLEMRDVTTKEEGGARTTVAKGTQGMSATWYA